MTPTRAILCKATSAAGGYGARAAGARRCFSGAVARWSGKESTLHTEGRGDEVLRQKDEQLEQVRKHGQAEWMEGLASDSESAIKADRNELADLERSANSIRELRREAELIAASMNKKQET